MTKSGLHRSEKSNATRRAGSTMKARGFLEEDIRLAARGYYHCQVFLSGINGDKILIDKPTKNLLNRFFPKNVSSGYDNLRVYSLEQTTKHQSVTREDRRESRRIPNTVPTRGRFA